MYVFQLAAAGVPEMNPLVVISYHADTNCVNLRVMAVTERTKPLHVKLSWRPTVPTNIFDWQGPHTAPVVSSALGK